MSDADDLTDGEAFALIEGQADALQVAIEADAFDDEMLVGTLESIKEIAADHYDRSEVEQNWEDW